MFSKSAVAESESFFDPAEYTEVREAQAAWDSANVSLQAAAAHQQRLFEEMHGDDPIVKLQVSLSMDGAIRALQIAKLEEKQASDRLASAKAAAYAPTKAEWEKLYAPAVSALFDQLVKVGELHREVLDIDLRAEQIGRVKLTQVLHPQFRKDAIEHRIEFACRELGMTPDRWLPLD